MAVFAGPKTVSDGLVFQIDQDNTVRSWKGKPTTNVISDPNDANVARHGSSVYTANQYSLAEDVKRASPQGQLADLISGSGIWIAHTNGSAVSGVQYADSWYVKGVTATNVFWSWGGSHTGTRVSFTVSLIDGSISNETSVEGESYGVEDAGNGWWRIWATTTLSGTANYPQLNFSGSIYLCGAQKEQGSFATPFVIGTRSNTQSVIDIIGERTTTANSLTYNSDNTFSFNGSSDYITTTEVTHDDPNIFSISCWIKMDTTPSGTNVGHPVFFNYSSSEGWFLSIVGSEGKVQLRHHNGTSTAYNLKSNTVLSTGEWYHIIATDDDSTVKIYINGVLDASTSSATAVLRSGHSPVIGNFGSFYFDGDISQMKVYNKALTADEVVTNFEASRDRYGV